RDGSLGRGGRESYALAGPGPDARAIATAGNTRRGWAGVPPTKSLEIQGSVPREQTTRTSPVGKCVEKSCIVGESGIHIAQRAGVEGLLPPLHPGSNQRTADPPPWPFGAPSTTRSTRRTGSPSRPSSATGSPKVLFSRAAWTPASSCGPAATTTRA